MPEHAISGGAVAVGPLKDRSRRSGAAGALGIAGLCLLALAAVWVLAQLVPAAHLRDAVALRDFTLLSHPRVDSLANFLVHLLEPALFILWAVAIVAVALARERPRLAVAVGTVMALAPLTAETLKPLLAHPHATVGGVYIAPASWPSGHATAAMTLVLCAALVTPRRLRPLVSTLGGVYALAAGCSLLILAWHMPSDVLGGYLVATLWAALAVAFLKLIDRRWPPRAGRPASFT